MQVERNIILDREISKDCSRVDFIIHNNNETYIIENKIDDKNHHFGVYEETYNVLPEKFGYIANYKIEQPTEGKNYALRTWKDFYNQTTQVSVVVRIIFFAWFLFLIFVIYQIFFYGITYIT